ncbi:MAG: hypothetical protein K2P68_01280 [Sphingomonas sp.]|nr:hypothetical protein [Sphingomonas sp.]
MHSALLGNAVRAATMIGLAMIAGGATKPPVDYIVRGDGVVPATVGGTPTRVRISPWAPAAPTLNPDFADRIGLHGGLFGFVVKVGTVKVKGQSSVTKLQFGTTAFRRRVVWFERPYVRGADLAVGPGGLPVDIVRFQLRAPQPGERTVALPLIQKLFQPTYARIQLGKRDITILFDPAHERTLATAGAGQALADALGGQLTGETGQAEIAFGINRPIRLMRLNAPLAIGPLNLSAIALRISDNGSTGGIPDADADPDEIVVTAKKSGDRRDVIIVGNDQLQRCSSIVFDKPAKQIRLTCR